jgi:hypothetical protein
MPDNPSSATMSKYRLEHITAPQNHLSESYQGLDKKHLAQFSRIIRSSSGMRNASFVRRETTSVDQFIVHPPETETS